MVSTSILFYLYTCGPITRSTVTSFSNAPILQNYDPWLLKTDMECLQDTEVSQNDSDLSHFTTCQPVLHSKHSGVLGNDLVIVSRNENCCHIALIIYNECETGISSYGPQLSFPLWRGYPKACWTLSGSWHLSGRLPLSCLYVTADIAFFTCEHIFNGHHHLKILANHKNTCTPTKNLTASHPILSSSLVPVYNVGWLSAATDDQDGMSLWNVG